MLREGRRGGPGDDERLVAAADRGCVAAADQGCVAADDERLVAGKGTGERFDAEAVGIFSNALDSLTRS